MKEQRTEGISGDVIDMSAEWAQRLIEEGLTDKVAFFCYVHFRDDLIQPEAITTPTQAS